MQTNNAKQKNNKTNLIALGLILLLTLTFGFFSNINSSTICADSAVEDRAYKYIVSQENGLFTLKGLRNNLTEYVITTSALNINDVMGLIEMDRDQPTVNNDVEITFDNLDLGNSSILFNRGEYLLKGSASFSNISSNACVLVQNNAHLTLAGINLSSQGFSTLFDVKNARLDINACVLNSSEEVLKAGEGSIVNIFGSTLISNNETTILAICENNSPMNMPQIKIGTNAKIKTNANQPAIRLKNASANIQTAEIIAENYDYALVNEGEGLKLTHNPTFISKKSAFSTKMFFSANNGVDNYNGDGFKVFYSGEITSADVALVINPTADLLSKITILNSDVALRSSYMSIYISKQFKVVYHANCNDKTVVNSLPKDTKRYFNLDQVQLDFLNLNVREHFGFVGWSKNPNASIHEAITSGTLTIEGEDLNIYAIWKPTTYSITYQGLDGVDNYNYSNYNYESKITLNAPSKQYHDFVGWAITGVNGVHSTLTLPYANLGNIEVTPIFELSEYDIIYNNLTSQQVSTLNLKTKYTIQDANLVLSSQKYALQGHSYFGIYSNPELTNSFAGKVVSFSPNIANDFGFIVGDALNVYVDIKCYHNGQGSGESSNPFIIEDANQFKSFLMGEKVESQQKVYIKLANDIEINFSEELRFVTLKNYSIDGNKKALLINRLIQFRALNNEKILTIFPRLDGCELKDLNIKNAENVQKVELNETISSEKLEISIIVHNLVSSIISNVQNNLVLDCNVNSTYQNSELKLSGIVGVTFASVLNNVRFNGKISLNSNNLPSTIYACGLVCESQNSMIVNSKFNGVLECKSQNGIISNEVCTYFAGVGILTNSNLLVNVASQGKLKCQANENICILSGIAINLGKENAINNCLALSNLQIEKVGDLKSNQKMISCVWGISNNIVIENVLCMAKENLIHYGILSTSEQNDGIVEFSNFDYVNLVHLEKLENGMENAQTVMNSFAQNMALDTNLTNRLSLASWLSQSNVDDDPGGIYAPVLNLTVKDAQTGKEKVYVFELNYLPGYVFIIKDGYLFKNYSFDAEGKQVVTDLSKLKGDVVVYANYITYNEYIWQNFIWWVIVGIIVLIALITFIIYCEMKKKVVFVFDGKVVHEEMVRINAKLPKVKGKEDILWFEDGNGNKPFTKTKMPFVWKELKLMSFKDEIRIPLEKLYEQERLAKELLVLQKQKIKDQKEQLKQENKAKNKISKQQEVLSKKQKSNLKSDNLEEGNTEKKKTAKQDLEVTKSKQKTTSKKGKKKAQQEIENSGITIVKKEIKTLPKTTNSANLKSKKDK